MLSQDRPVTASILAPLAVAASHHGHSVGTALIRQALRLLRDRQVDLLLVLGDPAYYSRNGFRTDHRLLPPYDLKYPEAWLAIELSPGVPEDLCGRVRCAD